MTGRKGVRFGDLDTGKTDANGRPLTIPLADIFGLGRGARVTGARAFLQAKYYGLTDGNALDAAARDVVNSAISPALGPPIRALAVAATGHPLAVNMPRAAPVAPPGRSQAVVNIEEALKEANPVVRSYLDYRAGKPMAEVLRTQLPRFMMAPGKSPSAVEQFPRIVQRAQAEEYSVYLAKEARKLPMADRWRFVYQTLNKDVGDPAVRAEVLRRVRRHGVSLQ